MSNFTEMDCYLFGQATHYDIYRKMGAHKMTIEGEEGVCFDVWAPHADRVYVIGEFNGWNETSHEMKRVTPETMGVYELFVPGAGFIYRREWINLSNTWLCPVTSFSYVLLRLKPLALCLVQHLMRPKKESKEMMNGKVCVGVFMC